MEISLLETFRANCSRGSLQVVSPQGRSASQQVCDERLKDIDNTSQLGNMSSVFGGPGVKSPFNSMAVNCS